ncbi:MAG: ABC transporter permease [Clostridia bacterium]
MKRDMKNQDNLRNEVLNDTNRINNAPEMDEKPPIERPQQALDDTRRVKVLSPGRLVFKRFMRSKLAIAGSWILIFMFAFAFLGGLISPYKQEEIFFKYGPLISEYGRAIVRTEYDNIIINPDVEVHRNVRTKTNSNIASFTEGQTEKTIIHDGEEYLMEKFGDNAYLTSKIEYVTIGDYNQKLSIFVGKVDYNTPAFISMIEENLSNTSFEYQDESFLINKTGGFLYKVIKRMPKQEAYISTNLVFDMYVVGTSITDEFKILALKNIDEDTFTYDGTDYTVSQTEEDLFLISKVEGGKSVSFANMSRFVVRRQNGEDTIPIDFKLEVQKFILGMEEEGQQKAEFTYKIYDTELILDEEETEEEDIIIDEPNAPAVLSESLFIVERQYDLYVIKNEQIKKLIDIYSTPTGEHWLGTDANGMDVLTRMMYGGRISLMIGFIVIIIEVIIGVILGGIAGYFGKWVDQLIMRIVDIFNCIPFLPLMIIIGSVFDKMQLDPYDRIMYLMLILGVLGWPGIARLVRGQILSLREQEFMIAAEATGLSAKRRIFRHLVPNVMPQLIVTATMGLGGIIITESTLSFLGLGAKYPLATWGAMINSVSDAASLVNYTYIWIPIGLLICLTVIAFNFVGDGLRDAFDPKMKR